MAAEHVIAGICGFTAAIGLVAYAYRQIIQEHFDQRERELRRKAWERHRRELEAQWRRTDEEFERRTGRSPAAQRELLMRAALLHVPAPVNNYRPELAPPPIAPQLPAPHNPGRRRILPLQEPES